MSAAAEIEQTALVGFLQNPQNYGEHPREVQVIETHISWVFLTDRFAYKLKKPVHYTFLDFSTIEKRLEACQEELRINRRLAPDVYLAVVPIWQVRDGQFRWHGEGEPFDWLVKMRRLPHKANLQSRLEQGTLTERELESLADYLAEFYRGQPPLTLLPEVMRQRLTAQIRDNLSDLSQQLPDQINRLNHLHAAQLRYVTTHSRLLDSRVCDGRYVEAHGDLRPEHIYLLSQPRIIDGIEFSRSLRELDIADELSFLAMECERLGHPGVGQRIIDRYTEDTGDRPPRSLLAFYGAYRACVRAKVHTLQASQHQGAQKHKGLETALEYLRLAEQYQQQMGQGLIVAVCGLMGSGKTTLATALADALGATLLQTDQVRRERFGIGNGSESFGKGVYAPEYRHAVYADILQESDRLLEAGTTVIVDGTFADTEHRKRLCDLADRHHADCLLVHCDCPREVALQRIAQRRATGETLSEARQDLYDEQAAAWDAPGPNEPFLRVDAQEPIHQQLDVVLDALAAFAPTTRQSIA
jgi:uncharacterized protein